MSRILVTGGAGFIGSHVVDAYVNAGHNVTVVDDLSSGKLQNINKNVKLHKLNITDKTLEEAFQEARPEVVNHLAAQISVKLSMKDPAMDAKVNILGSLNLIALCQKYKVKRFIFSSTGGALYGEPLYLPCDEAHPINPLSSYGVAKRAVELYLQAFRAAFGFKYVVLRYANVYGPRQDPLGEAGVVAIFAQRMLNRRPVTIFGTGKQSRDFVYVADVVQANLLALTRGEGGMFNIGTGSTTSVNELYLKLKTASGYRLKPQYAAAVPGEVSEISLDSRNANRELGWQPKTRIDQGLKQTLQFFKKTAASASS